MKTKRNRLALVGLAGLALAVSGGVAVAASSDGERKAFLDDAAERLGVDPSKLENALEEAAVARVDAAVVAGRLTAEQAERMKEHIRSGEGLLLGIGGFGHHRGSLPLRTMLAAAASYLGVTEAALHEARVGGKSLAELAEERGKSADGLERAVQAAARKELDEAVQAGDLTPAERTEALDRIAEHIDDIVQRSGSAPGPRLGPPPGGAALHAAA